MNPTRPSSRAVVAVALTGAGLIVAVVLATYLYWTRSAPESAPGALPDPLSAAASGRELALDLARHLERNPRDGRAWVLLAREEFAGDRFHEAAQAYARALDVGPTVARDPGIWCEYADALALANGGVLAGRPRELIAHALELDATHPRALEMAGSAAYEAREYALAARYWRQLLASLAEGTEERRELAQAIARAERLASGAGGAPR